MAEKSTSNKPEWLSALGALALWFLSSVASRHLTSTAEAAVPKELLLDTAAFVVLLVGWLFSWLFVYRRRDSRRERIHFAREHGRKICPCTELGEIMELRTKHSPHGTFDAIACPKCDAWLIPEEGISR